MRKTILFAAAVIAMLSCSKQLKEREEFSEPGEGGIHVLEAVIMPVKTYLGDKTGSSYPNYWGAGDAVSVNGLVSDALAEDSEYAGTDKATFTVEGVLNAPYRYAYPASAVSSYSNGSATITLPKVQQWSSTSYDPAAFIMVGSSTSLPLSFSPQMSVVKLTMPGSYDAKIASVMFESLGTEKVSGAFTTDFSGLTAASGASSHVNLFAPQEGVNFGSSVFVLIPAQTYASGMRFTIRATDGTSMPYSTTASFTARAGTVYTLTAKSYAPVADPEPDGLMVMSSNVRFASARDKTSNPDTGDRDWTNRKSAYYAMVNNYRPAVIGLQEAEKEQVKDILAGCSGYSHYGLGRKNGNDIISDGSLWGLIGGTQSGEESQTILYRTDLITLGDHGTVWHSNTPNSAGSYFPEMTDKVPQTSTWAILTYKPTNTQFFYMNVHLSLYDSRPNEITLIMNTVSSKNTGNLPVIMTGDWNLMEGDSWLGPLENAYSNARHTAQRTDYFETYHWWGTKSKIIDHIYYGGIGNCYLYRTDKRKWNNKYVSDHYPVYAVFDLGSTVHSLPTADFDLPANPVLGEPVTFTDRSVSDAGIATWSWDINGIRSTAQNPQVTISTVMTNATVTLTVVDNEGRKASASKLFTINQMAGGSSHEDYEAYELFD